MTTALTASAPPSACASMPGRMQAVPEPGMCAITSSQVKGVEAVAVHGGKDQEDREAAIDAFKVCALALAARRAFCALRGALTE